MGDAVLTSDGCAIGQAGGNMMREIGVDSWNDGGVAGHTADGREEVDCGFEGAGEEAGTVDVSVNSNMV